jgi:predicted enzyme related to lactoylglutathione lyase
MNGGVDMHQWNGTAPADRSGRRWLGIAFGALCLAFASACASSSLPRIPPVTEEPTHLVTPGKFVWVDLVTQDVAQAKSFYGALFGWTFENGDRYTPVLRDGRPIAGIVPARDPERGSEWVGNLSVADVDRAAALMKKGGGVVERDPVDAPDRGRIALVSDPEGALLLLVRAEGGDPPDGAPAMNGWLWNELWTHDVEGAINLYSQLAGYERDVVEFRDVPYPVLRSGDVRRAGVVEAPPEVNPLWLPYVRVEDAASTAARAVDLGARLVMQDDRTAILVDPTGAPIGIGVWSGRRGEGTEEAR